MSKIEQVSGSRVTCRKSRVKTTRDMETRGLSGANMGKIENFEDIEAWKKARELTREIYAISNEGRFARDFGLRDQIRRAAVSVMSNVAEGFERGGDVEFRRFLAIAKGSAGEVKAQLYVALDAGLIDRPAFDSLYKMATETGSLIGGFMRYLSRGSAGHESRVRHEKSSKRS